MSGEGTVGIGVVGTGGWARGFWAEAREAPEVRIVACWDPVAEHAAKFADAYGGEPVESLEALLGRGDVEAIANFAPNNHHRGPTEQAAAAGKHVYTEKPIANTIEDGTAMVRACERHGVVLMVGHSARYAGASRVLKSLLEGGRLGEVAMVEANASHSGGRRLTEELWRWHRDEAPGGPLMQLSVHVFDTLHYLFGRTRRVTALSKADLLSSEIEDVFLALLEFDSGLLGYVGTNYVSPASNFMRVYGTGGNAYSEGGELTFLKVVDAWRAEPESVPVQKINAPAAEMAEFARAIRTGTAPETGGPEGMLALGVVWACILSAERGAAVSVDEALGEATALVG